MNQYSISKKLNFILFTIVIFVLSVSGIISYNISKEKMQKEMIQNLSQIEKRLKLILPPIIWNIQYDLAQEVINVEALDDAIDAIIIKDVDKSLIASKIKSKNNLTNYDKHIQKFNIVNNNEIIANIFIYHNENKINSLKKNILIDIIIKTILILLFLQFLFSFFINKYIISNIKKLKNSISTFSYDKDFTKDIIIKSTDEIHFLAEEFNDMKNSLKVSWEQLNQLNNDLEKKVQEEVELNKKNQLHLFRSEKMVAMGEMIGNIAHQWRQPLSIISTSATALSLKNEHKILTDQELQKSCDIINQNAQYLSKTIDDFKNFIKGDRDIEIIDLKNIIEKFLNLVSPSIKKDDIQIILNLEKNISFKGYPSELIQCFINIFNNARDVLITKEKQDRIMIIVSKVVHEQICITFQDTGGGIQNEILPKIFDPYFTTKHNSQGTGLGLNMTYKLIVEGMDGRITAKNKTFSFNHKEYTGALFTIYLPYLDVNK